MPTFINVPFSNKDEAKALGARWSGEQRSWYVPDGVDIGLFEKWLPASGRSLASAADIVASVIDTVTEKRSVGSEASEGQVKGRGKPEFLTLSGLMRQVGQVISKNFSNPLWVQVEVSKINDRSRHTYFDFVEYDDNGRECAKARGSLWAEKKTALYAKFQKATGSAIQDGMKLLLLLKPEFSPQYGFSFIVEDVDPAYTLGDMQAKIKAIRDALIKAGLYENNKRLTKPFDFTRVAVISPEAAAGLADFMREADILQNAGLCRFDYFSAVFQGKAASQSILGAIEKMKSAAAAGAEQYDCLVIIRGGGAAADLAWLNDYEIAKAVACMRIPVLTGIGHQVDDTILDEVANIRFDTPSKVSAHITGTIIANAEQAIQNTLSLVKDANKAVTLAETRIEALAQGVRNTSIQAIDKADAGMSLMLDRIRTDAFNILSGAEQRIYNMMSEVLGLSPKKTIERGFALVRNASGTPVTSTSSLKRNDTVSIELKDGKIYAIVDEITGEAAKAPASK